MNLRPRAALLVLFITAATTKAAIGPSATLTVSNANASPDGFTRAATVVDGTSPGPLITAKKGETLKLKVVNQLEDPQQERGTSIHWHGLYQHGTNFMDGAAGISQCPIAPGNSFEYSFKADHAGSFWYHSHFGLQYCDGLRGPMVIYDPNDPLDYLYDVDDESTIITLSEWYHVTLASIDGQAFADSTLINGRGRFAGGPATDLAVVNVEKGKKYRLRIISISCDPFFIFSIDNHDLVVIEADGTEVRPIPVNSIRLMAGQRHSAVLHANQKVDSYWIRSLPNTGKGDLATSFEGGINSAILRYKGAPKSEPTSKQQSPVKALAETDLHPLGNWLAPGKPTPDGADLTINLNFTFDEDLIKFKLNGAVFEPPSVPVLLQILSGARNAHDLLPTGGVITVPKGKVVQINLHSGLFGGPHAFHLHGHDFSVVKSADANYNFLQPPQRDVTNMGETEGDIVSIRFKTDNPGPWIFHCHIDVHLAAGLAVVFAEAPDQTPAAVPVPDSWKELCPAWDVLPDEMKHPNLR